MRTLQNPTLQTLLQGNFQRQHLVYHATASWVPGHLRSTVPSDTIMALVHPAQYHLLGLQSGLPAKKTKMVPTWFVLQLVQFRA